MKGGRSGRRLSSLRRRGMQMVHLKASDKIYTRIMEAVMLNRNLGD